MPSGKYYRTQAQLFASLAVTTRNPQITARYNEMALEQLAKAEEAEPRAGQMNLATINPDGVTDMDRD